VAEREWETVIALREAWIKWSAADEQIAVTRSYLDDLSGLISIVERMLEAGEMNRLNVRLFQIERLSTEQELALLDGARARLAIEIRQLMGLAPAADVALVPRLHKADAHDASQAIDALVIERNPSLQTLLASYESSERALELEIRKQYPDIVIGPAHEYDSGTHRLGLGVSLPLPIFNANRLAIAQARAERERAMAALHAALEDVLSALAAADVDLEAAARRRRIVEEQIVPMVDAQFSDAREVARLGEVDTWLLLETLRTRFEVKQQLIELLQEESAVVIGRARLIGPAPIAIDELEIEP
jgi:outer membrane protein TolC